MSAIASFLKVDVRRLDDLRGAAVPKGRGLGASQDGFQRFLRENAAEVARYPWSGYVLATLLPYLESECQIDLMRSEHSDLANFLSAARGITCFVLTVSHREAYASQLSSEFSVSELTQYYNTFNGCNEAGVGQAMLDGIHAIRQGLEQLSEGTVALLLIG